MLDIWRNFQKDKPKLKNRIQDLRYSDQLMFCIDNKAYMGFYTEKSYIADDGMSKALNAIQLCNYNHTLLDGKYSLIKESIIIESDFLNYDIYWSEINILDMILTIDLVKMKEEKNDS